MVGGRQVDVGLVSLASEGQYGVRPDTFTPFPVITEPYALVHEVLTYPVRPFSAFGAERASRSVRTVVQLPDLIAELDGEAGIWTSAMEAGGFRYRADLSTDSREVWRTGRGDVASVAAQVNLDGLQHTVVGCRGNSEFLGEAGGPLQLRTLLTGLSDGDMELDDLVPDQSVFEQPITVCDAQFAIEVEGAATIVPVLRSFRVAPGRQLVERRPFSTNYAVSELRVTQRTPTWECVIDQDETDWMAYLTAERRFGLSMALSLGARTIEFRSIGRSAFLAAPPRAIGDSGLLGASLVFGITGQADGELEIARS